MLAESQYAWTLANGDSIGNSVWQASQVDRRLPGHPRGQLSFYNDALSILAQVPADLGPGLFYWEPEWIPGVGWEPGAGSPNDNLTLFSFTGQALPSVGLFQSPLAVCAHVDPWDPRARCRRAERARPETERPPGPATPRWTRRVTLRQVTHWVSVERRDVRRYSIFACRWIAAAALVAALGLAATCARRRAPQVVRFHGSPLARARRLAGLSPGAPAGHMRAL